MSIKMNGTVRSKVKNINQLLKDALGDDLQVIDENYKMLTATGEHYGSIMLAVNVTVVRKSSGKQEVLHLVAKLVPANEMLKTAFNTATTFKKEVRFYLELVPAVHELQTDHQVTGAKVLDIFPQCLGARIALDENKNEVDNDAAIIFENLKTQGYIMEDRLVGFDLPHTAMIVKDLAHLHATMIALRQLRPDVYAKKVEPVLALPSTDVTKLPKDFIDVIFDKLDEIGLPQYSPRVHKSYQLALDDARTGLRVTNPLFATVVHFDYWVNNTMVLRAADGRPLRNKIVDWQLVREGSGMRDLVFFLFSSVQDHVLDEHWDELIRLYYEEFVDTLKDYKLEEAYTWEGYQKELDAVGLREAFHALFMVKPIFSERGQFTNTLEDFEDSDFTRCDLLGDKYNRKLKAVVERLAKRNWI